MGHDEELADLAKRSGAAAYELQDHRLTAGDLSTVYRDVVAGGSYAASAVSRAIESGDPRIPGDRLRRSGLNLDGTLAR